MNVIETVEFELTYYNVAVQHVNVTVNESQTKIPGERGQDFVWHVEQRNIKAYFKFDVSENRENVE